MNKAITDGLTLMPLPFASGLALWSSEDGTPGATTYAELATAALVPADQDFGDCLEMIKVSATQKLRYMGETPIVPGCYLRVKVKIKAISGPLCSVRIAAWAGSNSTKNVSVPQTGPTVDLTAYGKIETLELIIGSGPRKGVDLVWGTTPVLAHFGLDLTGANTAVVRIANIEIADITSAFHRTMMDWVDVVDYGAVGDGQTDCINAFRAAEDAANGRSVLIPEGQYYLSENMTFTGIVRFQGTVVMPANKRLALTRNLDLPTYAKAFGNEMEGFRRGFQALMGFSDNVSFDLCGRRVDVNAPFDMSEIAGDMTFFAIRRVICNGQFYAQDSTAWNNQTVTSRARYSSDTPTTLSNVQNIENVPVGALVTGNGVGREVYVREKDVAAGTITLNLPLFDAPGNQIYTFTRFQYLFDFSGFSNLSKFEFKDVDLQCNGHCSTIMLARGGNIFRVSDCVFTKPKDRAITSIGSGCQGMHVDNTHFISPEQEIRTQDRISLVLNANANDVKIRNNLVARFGNFAVLAGSGNQILGNHFYLGDNETDGLRRAGLIITAITPKTTITGNYVDNCFIEWSNEHDPNPGFNVEYSFGEMTITGNIFTANDVASWFNFLVIAPKGSGHFVRGLTITDNAFRTYNGWIDRVDGVDTSYAGLNYDRTTNLTMTGNVFNSIKQVSGTPMMLAHVQNTAASTWTIDAGAFLPFGCTARTVQAVQPEGPITSGSNEPLWNMPYALTERGAGKKSVTLNWAEAARGKVHVTIRADQPI